MWEKLGLTWVNDAVMWVPKTMHEVFEKLSDHKVLDDIRGSRMTTKSVNLKNNFFNFL